MERNLAPRLSSGCPDAELAFDKQFVHEILREVVHNLSGTTL